MDREFNLQDFQGHLNTMFRTGQPGFPPELKLITARDLGSDPGHVQFSLVFLAPGGGPVQQGLHHLEHDGLGQMDIFLVPIGRNDEGAEYEAVFNRFIK